MDKYSDIPFEIDGEITKNELKGVLKEAVYRLYTKDGYLIKNGPASPKCSDNHVCERACLISVCSLSAKIFWMKRSTKKFSSGL